MTKLALFLAVVALLLLAGWAWVTQPLLPHSGTPAAGPSADPARLERHVRILCERFFPRDAQHPENLEAAAGYIRETLQSGGADVTVQAVAAAGGSYHNVVARFGPDTSERLVVGAHYDTAGPIPGADDNASGVASLLELAQLLRDDPLPLRVDLVAYALEEVPYFRTPEMASAVHARSLRAKGVKVRMMLALEMLGYFSDIPGSQAFPLSLLSLFYPTMGNFIAVVGKLDEGLAIRRVKRGMRSGTPLPVYSISAPRSIPGVDWSDHRSYWAQGYPAAMITDTAFYRNPHYHTGADRPDTLDYRRMAMVVDGVLGALRALAD